MGVSISGVRSRVALAVVYRVHHEHAAHKGLSGSDPREDEECRHASFEGNHVAGLKVAAVEDTSDVRLLDDQHRGDKRVGQLDGSEHHAIDFSAGRGLRASRARSHATEADRIAKPSPPLHRMDFS
jgi:hypothetical protein